jgi:signal transduction histidine kinase
MPIGEDGGHSEVVRLCRPIMITDTEAELTGRTREFARIRGFRSRLSVPLIRDGIAIGSLGVTRPMPGAFTDREIALLQTFADQAVIAIENVRLFKELEARNRDLGASADILGVIASSPTNVQPVFDTIVGSAARLCDAVFSALATFDGELMDMVAGHNWTPAAWEAARRIWPCPPSRGLFTGRAVIDRAVVHVPDVEVDREYASPEMSRAVGFRSILAVPMIHDGASVGAIIVGRATPGRFSDSHVALLKTFADQAVIAIENVRLFTELQERNKDLGEALERQTATADILRAISQAYTDVQPVFEAIAESAMRLFGAWAVGVVRYDGEMVSMVAARGGAPGSADAATERLQPPHRPTFPPELTVLTKRVHQVADVETDPSCSSEFRQHAVERGFRSFVAMPMVRGEDALGLIAVTRAAPGSFSPAEVALLQTFADQAVIAIENTRLLGELRARTSELMRSVDELTALGDVSRALSSTLDLDAVLQTIVARANQLAGTDACSVFEYDDATEAFHLRATNNLDEEVVTLARQTPTRKGEGVQGRMALTRQPVQVPDIAEEDAYHGPLRDTLLRTGTRAVLAIPMLRENELIGGLTVNKRTPGEFSPEVIELLRTFATQSALAIQNARLFHEIEVKSRQLEAASRHKSEFLANMSHELRTPLNAIIGFSEVLGERMFGELNEKQEEYLKDIHASGQHLLSLINDILDLSKVEAGRMELELTDFNLPATLDNALPLVRERAGRRGIALHITTDERLDYIRADERKVRQVVLNLLSNAIKFTPEGGRIDVRAILADGAVEVSVSDTGVGIAPEDQDAIFEEFRQVGTAEKKVEGTGLGLALSRKFIELHGGRIWVKSEPGVGSTFTFSIPARTGP